MFVCLLSRPRRTERYCSIGSTCAEHAVDLLSLVCFTQHRITSYILENELLSAKPNGVDGAATAYVGSVNRIAH